MTVIKNKLLTDEMYKIVLSIIQEPSWLKSTIVIIRDYRIQEKFNGD